MFCFLAKYNYKKMLKHKIFNLDASVDIFSAKRKNTPYFIMRKKGSDFGFLKIPSGFHFEFSRTAECKVLKVIFNNEEKNHIACYTVLKEYFSNERFTHKKKLIVKGTGYKVSLNTLANYLEFKLGHSHTCCISIPTDKIKVSILKNILCLESLDKSFLGNFCNKIMKLKLPDSYKDKGVCLKNKKYVLKNIKKK